MEPCHERMNQWIHDNLHNSPIRGFNICQWPGIFSQVTASSTVIPWFYDFDLAQEHPPPGARGSHEAQGFVAGAVWVPRRAVRRRRSEPRRPGNRNRHRLGNFDTAEQSALADDQAAWRTYGTGTPRDSTSPRGRRRGRVQSPRGPRMRRIHRRRGKRKRSAASPGTPRPLLPRTRRCGGRGRGAGAWARDAGASGPCSEALPRVGQRLSGKWAAAIRRPGDVQFFFLSF